MSDHKTAISKFLTDSNSERVAHIQEAQRQRFPARVLYSPRLSLP